MHNGGVISVRRSTFLTSKTTRINTIVAKPRIHYIHIFTSVSI
jgi:hypothetical protein